jgi:hypothetical protein
MLQFKQLIYPSWCLRETPISAEKLATISENRAHKIDPWQFISKTTLESTKRDAYQRLASTTFRNK